MKVRIVAAVALAAGIALGTAGCNLIQPQATTNQYDASDGVGVNVGGIQLRNLIVISDTGKNGNLLLSATNATGEDVKLHIEFASGGSLVDGHVEVPSNDKVPTSWGAEGEEPLILTGIDTQPGSLLEINFEANGKTATTLVPVLTSAQPEYEGLQPKSVEKKSK